jgi:hypothetical protein
MKKQATEQTKILAIFNYLSSLRLLLLRLPILVLSLQNCHPHSRCLPFWPTWHATSPLQHGQILWNDLCDYASFSPILVRMQGDAGGSFALHPPLATLIVWFKAEHSTADITAGPSQPHEQQLCGGKLGWVSWGCPSGHCAHPRSHCCLTLCYSGGAAPPPLTGSWFWRRRRRSSHYNEAGAQWSFHIVYPR